MTIEQLQANVDAAQSGLAAADARIAALEAQIADLKCPRIAYGKREAANVLGIHTTTLWRLEQLGLIHSCRGRISREELDRYLRENTKDKFQAVSPHAQVVSAEARPSQGITRADSTTSRRGGKTTKPGKI